MAKTAEVPLHIPPEWEVVGYGALVAQYKLKVFPHFCRTYIAPQGQRKTINQQNLTIEVLPRRYKPAPGLGAQIEFALKYEGVNLEVLSALFKVTDRTEIEAFIRARPKGKYRRRIWFLYEFLTKQILNLRNLSQMNYVPLLDSDQYFVAKDIVAEYSPRDKQLRNLRSSRHRILNNLLGDVRYCPLVRKTNEISAHLKAHWGERAHELMHNIPTETYLRAVRYLYARETKSSFEIEHVKPDQSRIERFIELLKLAETQWFIRKDDLVALQRAIVEERFANEDYRRIQSFVGTSTLSGEQVHYICPKPEDIESLMQGLLGSLLMILTSSIDPVVFAAVIGFGFVFIHPFDDGNGRLHRFLIHNILAKKGFTPSGTVFPLSATLLSQRAEYDALLEKYSQPLLALINYKFDTKGHMIVEDDTAHFYRYPDMTNFVEGLYRFVATTIETELPNELDFLIHYDKAKQALQEIVDMPDQKIDLFIRLCHQNKGKLSQAKRASHFSKLTDAEVERMEAAVSSIMLG